MQLKLVYYLHQDLLTKLFQATAYSAGNSGSYTGLIDFIPYNTYPGNGSGFGTVHNVEYYGLAAGCYHLILFDDYVMVCWV